MIIAVISCWKYRDAWRPFFALLDKFWPNRLPNTYLFTDRIPNTESLPVDVWHRTAKRPHASWCETLSVCAAGFTEPILLFCEDFFLTAPVNIDLVHYGLNQLIAQDVGCVRLYPIPGANEECGDPYFGII